jgi:general secretion pathway protein I
MTGQRAFTLLEVLIALAIVGIGLLALLGTSIENTRVAHGLEARTLAGYVAANEIEELRLAPTWPSLGRSSGHARLGGIRWRWTLHAEHTAAPGILRVRVGVRPAGSRSGALVTLTGFLGRSLLNRPSPLTSTPPPPGVMPNPIGPGLPGPPLPGGAAPGT